VKVHLGARSAGLGAVAGLLSGAVAVGTGQLVAGITGPDGSPVVAVGRLQIDFTPPALKNFAISAFGSHDKLVLVSGILAVLAIFAAVLGVLAMRRLAYGLAGLAAFAAIGVIAAATRPVGSAADVLPPLAAAAAGVIALVALIRAASAGGPVRLPRDASPDEQVAGTTGSLPVPAVSAGPPAPPERPATPQVRSTGSDGQEAGSRTGPAVQQGRRHFLVVSGAAASWPSGSASPARGRRCASPRRLLPPLHCRPAPTCASRA
jgi:hypothetical protein